MRAKHLGRALQQMAEEVAQLRSELTETREAMLWVQIDASAKVAGQGLEMESEMQEAAESHTRRLVELEAERRAKFDADLEEQVRHDAPTSSASPQGGRGRRDSSDDDDLYNVDWNKVNPVVQEVPLKTLTHL